MNLAKQILKAEIHQDFEATNMTEIQQQMSRCTVYWKVSNKCPKCDKKAYISSVIGYSNVHDGSRLYCPHCGYVEALKRKYR